MRQHFPRLVNLVPHTHWDREWYLPFQSFRLRLVRLVDGVLAMLEADERFVFTLDGQLQTVDDYLEIRPENEERIRRFVREGRLAVGPWQVLMDEFLVSGETIWRNLERGLERARELGGEMRVGYLPDMFGHIAQMPQILRAHGLDNAVVWRGVPAAVDRHRFDWRGIDGSSIEAEYLPQGYSNAAYLLAVPDRLSSAVDALVESLEPFFGDDPVLAMYGTDHQEPLPELVEVVERANAENGRVEIRLQTLDRALASNTVLLAGSRPTWTGEMRSGARANLLMNVTSARIDLKAAAARAERLLERYAEPLAALHGAEWPDAFLELAWRRVIENSAHDSICGCSADAVSAQVLVRYAEAEALGRDLVEEALGPARARTPRGAAVVANASPFPRADVVELDLPVPSEWDDVALELADGTHLPTQERERNEPELERFELLGREIPELIRRRLHGRELFRHWVNGFTVEPGPRLVLDLDTDPDPPWLDVTDLRTQIGLAAETEPDARWEVVLLSRPRRRLLARVPAPPLGWTSARAVEGVTRLDDPVRASPTTLDNGLVRVEVAEDGSLRLGGVAGVGRIVRGRDVGDSYNYAPPPDDVLVDEPDHVDVREGAAGAVTGSLVVERTYRWDGLDVPVATEVELRAGEPFVRIRVSFDNRHDDHRVRFHVPLPRPADRSFAEGQYAVVERPLEVEGGYGEFALPTYPAASFAAAGGVAALLEHVAEYEVLDGRELALTVHRSTGWISRNVHPYREDPAGPELSIPDAQLRGVRSFALALYVYEGERPGPDVLEQAERYRLPFVVGAGEGDAGALTRHEGLRLEGDGVVLTALRKRDGELEARIANETPEPRQARLGGFAVDLRPFEIRTLRPS